MAYDANKPANDDFIADAPQELRTNFDGLKNDQLVNAGLLNGLKSGNAQGNIPVSNGVVNTGLNADKLDGNDASAFANATHDHSVATGSSDGFMANTDKQKIDTVATGAEVNQNAFSNVLVSGTTIQADSKTDTFELVPGTNISLTPDATNDRVTIAVTGKVASAGSADSATNATTATTAYNLSGFTNSNQNSPISGAESLTNNGIGYVTGMSLLGQVDGALYGQSYSDNWKHVIYGDYRTGQIAVRGKNSGTWQGWRTVIDSGNIGSQSVNYANSAGSAPANGGNSATATKLATARTIAGVSFDGSVNIDIPYNNLTSKPTIPTIPTHGKQLFTTVGTATFTVPAGITRVWVTLSGGGGKGGLGGSEGVLGCGGGGADAKIAQVVTGLTSGASITITVGGSTSASSFGGYVSASGGGNGGSNNPGAPGGAGGSYGCSAAGYDSCHGGDSIFGIGGRSDVHTLTTAQRAGKGYGAGGAGNYSGSDNPVGAQGFVLVEW